MFHCTVFPLSVIKVHKKPGVALIVSLLLAAPLMGCRPQRMPITPQNPHPLLFAQAGVSLVVGEEWQCRNVGAEHGLYPPTLVSRAGTIRVLLLPPDRSDPAVVADCLRNEFDLDSRVAKHSFRKERFTSDQGVEGVCVSYRQRANVGRDEGVVENSHYLIRNRAGRCVAINYLAAADGVDSPGVHRMLQTSLALQ
jgi:hypothetical protein